MSQKDGLVVWVDGPCAKTISSPEASNAPDLSEETVAANQHLWVVRTQDVVHAPENCAFGHNLNSGVIKHTNLTGGEPAYAGGELLVLDEQTIVINGCSGRYGPSSPEEMAAVARAFADSGYGVWSMGWDDDAGMPAPFIGVEPEWVE